MNCSMGGERYTELFSGLGLVYSTVQWLVKCAELVSGWGSDVLNCSVVGEGCTELFSVWGRGVLNC
jgi:hypothetical protein